MSSIFFVMLPMIFLSGLCSPSKNMPKPIQALTYVMPLRYFFVVIRGIFLKGVGLDVLWPQALAMLGFGIAILGLSILRFRKRGQLERRAANPASLHRVRSVWRVLGHASVWCGSRWCGSCAVLVPRT